MEICWKILAGVVKPHDAIKQGCTEVFFYEEMYDTLRNYSSISSLWDSAAKHGNLRILQELKAHNFIPDFDWSLCYAAYHGKWDCFLWLIEQGKPIKEETMNWAAAGGQLKIIQWLHEKGYTCSERAMENAIEHQHQEIIEWLFVHGKPCSSEAVNLAILQNDERNMRRLIEEKGLKCTRSGTYYAAKKGDLDLVSYLYKKEMPFGSNAFNIAATMKHIHILEFLYQKGIKGTTEAMDHCAKNGDMETMEWLDAHEYTCSDSAATYAVENGHLTIFQWLLEHGKPINVGLCIETAAYRGYTHILEYLYGWIETEEENKRI